MKRSLQIMVVFMMLISTKLICGSASNGALSHTGDMHWPIAVEAAKGDSTTGDIELVLSDFEVQRSALILEVGRYLRDVNAPHNVSNANNTVSAEYIVEQCLENNFDISFLLAQGTIETGMGKAGAGRSNSRRSMFGIAKRSYKSYNDAIDGYISLVTSKYLRPNQPCTVLFNGYKTLSGARYAGNPHYEKDLKGKYNEILRKYDIYELQYKRLPKSKRNNDVYDVIPDTSKVLC